MRLDPKVHGAPILLELLPKGPLVGAEVGVLRGTNSLAFLHARPQLLLFCVDSWNHGGLVSDSPAAVRYQAKKSLSGFSYRIIWQEMDSHAAALQHASASLDFVYIDAAHDYKSVRRDITVWAPTVKPGGIIAGHDYGHPDYPGVKEAVDQYFSAIGGVEHKERTWWKIAD